MKELVVLLLAGLLIDGQNWEVVSQGHTFTEGPAADAAGNLYYTDVFRSKILRLTPEGKSEVFVDQSYGTNGLMFGPDGRLYGCQNGKKQIVAYDDKGEYEVVADGVLSNDLVVNRAGGIYFTDPVNHQIWYIAPGGEKRVVDKGMQYPNGLVLSPDQGTLYVVDMKDTKLWAFRVEADGSLGMKEAFGDLRVPEGRSDCGADGMTVDSTGRVYVATQLGLQVFDTQGRLVGVIDKPEGAWLANAAFAGPKLDTLYVTASTKVFKRKINAEGVRYFAVEAAGK
jgi:sugar lactone lactonase YvrE